MKISIVFLVGLCTAVLSTPVADQAQLKKQQQVLRLFYHVNQMSTYPEHVETGKSCFFCDKSSLYEKYEKPEVIDMMENYWKSGLVPRGEIFSIFYTEHFKQAVALFRMFYYAKTWDEFHRAACWARQNVNEGMFVYALSVALIHRPDCCGIMLPPIYEVLPHYFFNKEVINKAYRYKQIHSSHDVQKNPSGYPGFTITTNYTHDHMNLGPEQSMSYYMEDVDLNAAYYYYNLHYPFWMGSEEFGWKEDANRGHIYYYIYQQILAKYYLERISNGAGDIPIVDWKAHVQTPFNPSMMYPCGVDFPVRPKFVKLHEYFYNYGQEWKWSKYGHGFNFMDAFDRRIDDVIDQGFVIDKQGKKVMLDTKEGFNILANLIEHNWDSPNHMYYGPLWRNLRHFMGYSYQAENNWRDIPSALEQYETSMRDPAFYQIAKKLVTKFEKLLTDLPPYTKGELEFPGVTVDSLEFDPLITYNDWFYTDLTNAVFYSGQDDAKTFDVRVRQYRLNHKPFTYKIKMTSDKAQKVSIKVFMGPAHEIQGKTCLLNENRFNYVEFEHIVTDLKAGENVITRSSHDMEYYSPDRMAFREMYKRVKGALEGSEEFKIDGRQNFFQWPQRFMLPRGSASGTPFRFFVMVYPYVPYHEGKYRTDGMPAPGSGGIFIDNQTLGYPLDRFIPDEKMWTSLPNTHCQEVKVYFKDIYDINAPHH